MTPITSLREEAEDRAAFELWYVGHTFGKKPPEIERDGQGYYILTQVRQAWNAYHAAWMTGRNALVNELEQLDSPPSHPEYRSSGERGEAALAPAPEADSFDGITGRPHSSGVGVPDGGQRWKS